MIDCNGCYLNKLFESDEERMRCLHRDTCERAYQQGKADAIEDLFTRIKTYCRCNSCIGCRFLDDETCEIAVIKEQMKGQSE